MVSVQEQRANFAIWAILKSPLMVGTDLRRLSKTALEILTAEEVIAVNQDKLGVAGDLIWKRGPTEANFCPPEPLMALRHLQDMHCPDVHNVSFKNSAMCVRCMPALLRTAAGQLCFSIVTHQALSTRSPTSPSNGKTLVRAGSAWLSI